MALSDFVEAFALALGAADAVRPQAANARTGALYQPGIGPHTESMTIGLVLRAMEQVAPTACSAVDREVPYPSNPRIKCDLRMRVRGESWVLEVKMLRMLGDNGKDNDNILMHILSPYPSQRSALTDCEKLVNSGFTERKAIVIYGYEYPKFPMEPAIAAFETLARTRVNLSERFQAQVSGLVHPVHTEAKVVAWEVSSF